MHRFRAIFLAFGLVLTLETSSRFLPSFGFGELVLLVYLLIALPLTVPRSTSAATLPPNRFALGFLFWVLFAFLPVSLVNSVMGLAGSSMREYLAFLFSALIVLTVAGDRFPRRTFASTFVIGLVTFLVFQIFFGGNEAWYYGIRFTGGANNPNQLAIYLICAHVFTYLFFATSFWRVVLNSTLFFFGVLSGSDAYFLGVFLFFSSLVIFSLVPRQRLLISIAPICLLTISVLILFASDLSVAADVLWSSADEGHARLRAYSNGLKAWADTPFSILFGNGAGVYSGIDVPFGGWEAHNTYIDILANGGLLGAWLLLIPVLAALQRAYFKDQRLISASILALAAFIFFHYVGRQPLFWVTVCILDTIFRKRREVNA